MRSETESYAPSLLWAQLPPQSSSRACLQGQDKSWASPRKRTPRASPWGLNMIIHQFENEMTLTQRFPTLDDLDLPSVANHWWGGPSSCRMYMQLDQNDVHDGREGQWPSCEDQHNAITRRIALTASSSNLDEAHPHVDVFQKWILSQSWRIRWKIFENEGARLHLIWMLRWLNAACQR